MEEKKDKIACSVGILTFNSAQTLLRALSSVEDFAEIIICDGGSTDQTIEIARKYSCTIISQNKKAKNTDNTIKDFALVRNQCLDASSFNWFFYIDSDEVLSDGLKEEIRRVVRSNSEVYIYNIPIRIFIDGRMIKYSSNYPGYQNRFFNKKSGARFIKNVHERIYYNKNKFLAVNLFNPWHVFFSKDEARHYLWHNIGYVKLEVERSKNITFFGYLKWVIYVNLKTILKIILKSSKNYLIHGFRDSMPISVEWGRISYILSLMYFITKYQICRVRTAFRLLITTK